MTSRCGRCGKTGLGLVELRRSRVREHVRLLGILWMAYSALHVVAGVGAIVVANTILRPFHSTFKAARLLRSRFGCVRCSLSSDG